MKLVQLPLALLTFSVCALTASFGQDPDLIKRAEAGDVDSQVKLADTSYCLDLGWILRCGKLRINPSCPEYIEGPQKIACKRTIAYTGADGLAV